MKKKIALRRIFHHEKWRYGLFFSYDPGLTSLVRRVTGSRYSNTFKCWYVDENEDNLRQVIKEFRESADIDISEISSTQRVKAVNQTEPEKEANPVSDGKVEQAARINDEVSTSSADHPEKPVSWKGYGPVEFTIDEEDDKLIIKFTGRYDQQWISEIRSYGRVWFDPYRLEWVLDWSRLTVDSLSDYFMVHGVDVIVKRNEVSGRVRETREKRGLEIRQRTLSGAAINGMGNVRRDMEAKRYSSSTIEAYISLLGLFFKYFHPRLPSEITEDDISDFFHDHILYNKYSASYQNQIISAIKIYYRLNYSGTVDTSELGRPRRRRTLPKVFSKAEVKSILSSTRNIKHRLILWIIYSCGLRRSEVINIKISDFDRERGILNIREAKGKFDRIVPVSPKVWDKVDEYLESYHPSYWLFEGQTGGKYSSESVYRVFKLALKAAGIKKEVGVHSLRHSYATHLHESGLDIRYIQELLGHRNSRTTEIYTHVSRRNLVSVRSPIEDIDLR